MIFAAYNEKAYKESEIQRYFRLTTVDDNGSPVALIILRSNKWSCLITGE
ncbi:MAG: hypothetical protein ACLU4N_02375 [Butyricimonas faecihominis]